MNKNPRRQFLRQASALTGGLLLIPGISHAISTLPERKFRLCLNPGAIGVRADQRELLALAHRYGFEAMIGMPDQLAEVSKSELDELLAEMKEKDITWGAAGLPVQFRTTETKLREDLTALPRLAGACQRAGITRMNTWVMPTHDELTYLENFRQHQDRLQRVANILGHHGIRLGLEYVGPKTLMARDRYAFIRTMAEAKELIAAIGEPNVGFVLDSFHWYCAGESAADLLTLDKEDIVTVDLNDARTGFTADEQVDGQRELPAATGVIDMKGFLGALTQIGYEGPVRAEPFNARLNEMDNEAAVQATHAAMKKAIDLLE